MERHLLNYCLIIGGEREEFKVKILAIYEHSKYKLIQDIWKFKYQTGFYCVILSNFNDTVTIQSFLRLARATTIDVCCCVLCCVMWGQVQTNCVAYTFKWYHTRSKNTALAFIRYVIFVINYFVCDLLTVRLWHLSNFEKL